jgi:hypothetical protein
MNGMDPEMILKRTGHLTTNKNPTVKHGSEN